MTKKCPRCGATLRDDVKFCTVCGIQLSQPDVTAQRLGHPTAIPVHKCPRCGAQIKNTDKFCTKCGADVVPTVPEVQTTGGPACPSCGNPNNPPESAYCIRCGQLLPTEEFIAEPTSDEAVSQVPEVEVCPNCGREAKHGTNFCIYCGGSLAEARIPGSSAPSDEGVKELSSAAVEEPSKPKVAEPEHKLPLEVDPIPVPADVLSQLMSRGRQLALEDQYAKTGEGSDALLEDLSEAAENGTYQLEELIDTYINERTEQERLEALHGKGEVSDRVFERLEKEYDEKLNKMDKEITEGVKLLQGYLSQLRQEHASAAEQLETIDTRIRIGDLEGDPAEEKNKASEKVQRFGFAIAAAEHILSKEATMHETSSPRFEVTETTVSEAPLVEDEAEETSEEEPETGLESIEEGAEPSEETTPSIDEEAGKICSACGRVTASEAKFCIHCGEKLI